jgi:hypothetical protein
MLQKVALVRSLCLCVPLLMHFHSLWLLMASFC